MDIKINGQLLATVQPAATDNKYIPNFIEKPIDGVTNGYQALADAINGLTDFFKDVIYWINPYHFLPALWNWTEGVITSPIAAEVLIGGSIAGIILIGLGANWPKKWVFWGWIVYWTLRGFIFV